jgi:pimeloyl-ACP methyl ester carboxylesterase
VIELPNRFAVDGVEIAWGAWGAGSPPFLLCHGFSGSAADFDLHVDALAQDRRVLTIDHRGHGRSTKTARGDDYAVSRLAADAVAFADDVIGEPFDLLGHSMGGRIVLEMTLARPELIRSLILMDTSGWSFQGPDPEVRAVIEGFMTSFDPAGGLPDMSMLRGREDDLIEARTPADYQEHRLALQAAFDPYAMHALGRELWVTSPSVRDRLGEIRCPVTVIVGEHDHPFVDQADELAGEVADGRVVVIAGAYHSPQLTHQDEWRRAVEEHLARVAA